MEARRLVVAALIVLVPLAATQTGGAAIPGTLGAVKGNLSADDLCEFPPRIKLQFAGGFATRGIGFVGTGHTSSIRKSCSGSALDPFTIGATNPLGARLTGTCGGTFAIGSTVGQAHPRFRNMSAYFDCVVTITTAGGATATGPLRMNVAGVFLEWGQIECEFGGCAGPGVTTGSLLGTYQKA